MPPSVATSISTSGTRSIVPEAVRTGRCSGGRTDVALTDAIFIGGSSSADAPC
jgi:hypothetical protein